MERTPASEQIDWIEPDGVPGLVSIVIPTCNRSKLLVETLQSIFVQDYRPIQIIVVDDESTDDTHDQVAKLQGSKQPGIELLYHKQEKAGGPAARNRGARKTTGEFIVFMDDDDVFSNSFLASQMNALQSQRNANVGWSKWRRFRCDGDDYLLLDNKGDFPRDARSPWEAFLLGWELLLQSCVIRRSLVSEIGPWQLNLKKSQDLDYKARLLAGDCRLVEAVGANVFYRLHAASITGKLDAPKLASYVQALDDIESLAKNRDDYARLQPTLANYLWGHSFWLYASGCAAEGLRTLRQAKRHDATVSLRNGPLPSRLLARLGLDSISGPLLYTLFKMKSQLFGSKKAPIRQRVPQLPASKPE